MQRIKREHGTRVEEKIKEYEHNAYSAVSKGIDDAFSAGLENLNQDLRLRLVHSDLAYRRKLELHAERIREFALAHADGLIGGYEIYDAPLDDNIVHEISELYWRELYRIAKSIAGEIGAHIVRSGGHPQNMYQIEEDIKGNLARMTQGLLSEVKCMVAERKVNPELRPQKTPTGNITISGSHNPRINIHSVDQSQNTVTITEQNVFSQVRSTIKTDVPANEQSDLLERLNALETAGHKPTAMERYHQFVARAADHATLLPFLPKLLEIAKHIAQGI